MVIFTSMAYTLFQSKFVSSLLRFSAVQRSRGHQESAAFQTKMKNEKRISNLNFNV